MKWLLLWVVMLGSWPLYAQDAPDWRDDPVPERAISVPERAIAVSEPAPNEVVVVINDNALWGNHAGLFAGGLLVDPAGSYVGTRSHDKDWSGTTLADYARYQTVDGLKIHLYRFRLSPEVFSTLVKRMRDAGPTPPLFCASAVQNLIAGIAPFDGVEPVGWTSPTALGRILDGLTQGAHAIGECRNLDASPC